MPAVAVRSLMAMGTPWNGLWAVLSSATRALASASSAQTVTKALSSGSIRSIRSR